MAKSTVADINSARSGSRRRAPGGGSAPRPESKYPPEHFIVPGSDPNGNSMRVWCRVVPLLDRAMDVLFASRKFPFKSKGDLMRWCVKVGVDRLEEMEPAIGSISMQVDAMMSILRAEQHNHEFLTVFQTMAATVGADIQAQALGEARRVVAMMKAQIERMEEGYWRTRYLTELDNKFGYLIKGGTVAGAGLGSHIDGGVDRGTVDSGGEGGGGDEDEDMDND